MDNSPMQEAISIAKEFGFNQKTMRELEFLASPVVDSLSPTQIKDMRLSANLSQNLMAHYLNVSPSTYQKWERGEIIPAGGNMKLLNIVFKQGVESLMQ